jgi:hypothetical protein
MTITTTIHITSLTIPTMTTVAVTLCSAACTQGTAGVSGQSKSAGNKRLSP